MIDWGKYWITDVVKICRILANHDIAWEGTHSLNTGEVLEYPLKGEWEVWSFEIKSPTWLEVTGSLHKYWNEGTNETDFLYYDLYRAIVRLCSFLQVRPHEMSVHNLEFGVNIRPGINASDIMRDIICYKNRQPLTPIDDEKGYFLEFKTDEYYFKIYDKGKQASEKWKKESGNILRVEIKAINNGYLRFANINTIADLLKPGNLQLLGKKIDNLFRQVVFDDKSINEDDLKKPDRKVYKKLVNPRVWAERRKKKTTTIRAEEHKFRAIVAKYGTHKHNSTLSQQVQEKWQELLTHSDETLQEVTEYLNNCRL